MLAMWSVLSISFKGPWSSLGASQNTSAALGSSAEVYCSSPKREFRDSIGWGLFYSRKKYLLITDAEFFFIITCYLERTTKYISKSLLAIFMGL